MGAGDRFGGTTSTSTIAARARRTDEMETTQQPKRPRGHRGGPEPRVVAIEYRPAPDAEARLRRIAAILLDHATRTLTDGGDDGDGRDVR